ncbi:MAG: glycosyltransferase family 4 protein [Acidobacteria bacterium]|jgi:glycosyltransferase involved in cell wall biosynthesis|nr:glycosyltransferase family 4 protein [Acidobacteriota bacterium]
MNFGLDLRPSLARPTGVGTYVLGLIDRLPALTPDDAFYYFSASLKERYPARRWPSNVHLIDRRLPVGGLNLAWNRLGWPTLDRLVGAPLDLVHSPHPLLIPARHARRIVTIHDLFFLKHPEMTGAEIRRDYVDLVRDHARKADGVLCVSDYTAREAQALLGIPPEKIGVTPLGVDPSFREVPPEPQVAATLNRLRLPRGAILYVGSNEKRKNLVSLVMAYLNLAGRRREVPPLVLAGPGSAWAQGGDWVGPQIRATGYLPREGIRALMAASSLLVLPSLEEGFGLPVAEAMAAGLPVVCSRGSALEEVAGDAATLVDPGDAGALTQAIEHLLDDPAHAEASRTRGLERSRRFDWQDTARRTIAFYRTVLGR